MVRIFVSPSHLCTLYMILYARATHKPGNKDVLILDSPPKKRSLKALITGTQKLHAWHTIIDLSADLEDSAEMAVDARKKLTRKLKTKPVFKQVYDLLLKRYNKKQRLAQAAVISKQLDGLGEISEVNILSQTLVNDALFDLYPKAQVNYFEHGLGDYYHIQKIKKKDNYYCVFAEPFKALLQKHGIAHSYVKPLPGCEKFMEIAAEALSKEDQALFSNYRIAGKIVPVLGENMQLYQVPDEYYADFIDLVVKHVSSPQEYTFVLKPHPSQTLQSIQQQKKRLEEHHKLRTVVLESGKLSNFSVEVLFSLWKDQTEQFFSHISSAGFYNSMLYKESAVKFYYSYEFLFPYMKNAPPQYRSTYLESEELIKQVLAINSISLEL